MAWGPMLPPPIIRPQRPMEPQAFPGMGNPYTGPYSSTLPGIQDPVGTKPREKKKQSQDDLPGKSPSRAKEHSDFWDPKAIPGTPLAKQMDAQYERRNKTFPTTENMSPSATFEVSSISSYAFTPVQPKESSPAAAANPKEDKAINRNDHFVYTDKPGPSEMKIRQLQQSLNQMAMTEPVYSSMAALVEKEKLRYASQLKELPSRLHAAAHRLSNVPVQARLATVSASFAILRDLDLAEHQQVVLHHQKMESLLLATIARLEVTVHRAGRHAYLGPQAMAEIDLSLVKANSRVIYLEQKMESANERITSLTRDLARAREVAHKAATVSTNIVCPDPNKQTDADHAAQKLHSERNHLATYRAGLIAWSDQCKEEWLKIRSVATSMGMDVPSAPPLIPGTIAIPMRWTPLLEPGPQEGLCGCPSELHRNLFNLATKSSASADAAKDTN